MTDYMVRATAANAQIRAFACTTREMVETARAAHNTSPVMTAALGRLLSAGAMMGSMLKGEKDLLTLQIRGDGPGKGLVVTADAEGNVKGYPLVGDVIIPANAKGKLDVSGALGSGTLSIIRDMGLKEPYVGQVELQTGEIAEDLTYYFATSEQIPSCVGLGVLMERDNTVKQAGGFIIQLMPFTEDAVIERLEQNLSQVASVTSMLEEGKSPEDILKTLLDGFDLEIVENRQPRFFCNCGKERIEKALISVGKKELQEMIEDGETIEVKCHFCNAGYEFTVEELEEICRKA
ncbi:MAG: Hsp33 family molecular chaperone HslO [Lachnospiraceae bacterium]|nr:Hsp33 family molecular chaperone HslO [Lachnospiraceae bacterium]